MPIALDDSAATATLTSVAASATSVALLAANNARKGVLVMNDSTAIMYLAYAATASTTAYTVQIAGGGFWEMPLPLYRGALSALWAAATGSARLTELS